jgi:uncharacterized membrane protein YeaQ/YmgE (transglycosylase-associated protein family)
MPRLIAYVGLGLLYLLIIGIVGSFVGAFIKHGNMGGKR